ncbi:hypothetical protein JTE90_023991, partial [Oedothorax gibbosus]
RPYTTKFLHKPPVATISHSHPSTIIIKGGFSYGYSFSSASGIVAALFALEAQPLKLFFYSFFERRRKRNFTPGLWVLVEN